MLFSRNVSRIDWNQLNLTERMTMLSLASGPKPDIEWMVVRVLCFHKIAEITPHGLKLTRLGRQVMAERHGLPFVVGIDTIATTSHRDGVEFAPV